jgi:hypothetical protein
VDCTQEFLCRQLNFDFAVGGDNLLVVRELAFYELAHESSGVILRQELVLSSGKTEGFLPIVCQLGQLLHSSGHDNELSLCAIGIADLLLDVCEPRAVGSH